MSYLTKAHVTSLEHSIMSPTYIVLSSPTNANTFFAIMFPISDIRDPVKNNMPARQEHVSFVSFLRMILLTYELRRGAQVIRQIWHQVGVFHPVQEPPGEKEGKEDERCLVPNFP